MKKIQILILCLLPILFVQAQKDFNRETFNQFLIQQKNLSVEGIMSKHTLNYDYYSNLVQNTELKNFIYGDSIQIKYQLTIAELELLKKNSFMVTERLRYENFVSALSDIYTKDLPVFITSDAILHTIHASYDQILMDIERKILKPNLQKIADQLYINFIGLKSEYAAQPELRNSLKDIDLYVTMIKSLMDNTKLPSQNGNDTQIGSIWNQIQNLQMVEIPLFSDNNRNIDFSQFKVRGHYVDNFETQGQPTSLESYFKTMMWLGRIDFILTNPNNIAKLSVNDIKRMNFDAILLNELINKSGVRSLLDKNDLIITKMVGASDNLTPTQLNEVVKLLNINNAGNLIDSISYHEFQKQLNSSPDYNQKILSDIFIVDPYSTAPDPLPVSFRLMGQRFIIDSYIFSNVVYDRIVFEEKKIMRMMPDPLDAMFVLGNDNALSLLKPGLEKYQYSAQLNTLRYLVDQYDDTFWNQSLYNTWLNALRTLNPQKDRFGFPYFMTTNAWQQEKINTQLASWSQLRHDNLLYAKPSYTAGVGCSFPYAYVEPYPRLYKTLADFATNFTNIIGEILGNDSIITINTYLQNLKTTMNKLAVISEKELNMQNLSIEETGFLKSTIIKENQVCAPAFTGWYTKLFYRATEAFRADYIIADIHTQPTDEAGIPIGKVLHVGVGQINMGVFLAPDPSNDYKPTAYAGPVFSYYEKVTTGFLRLSDQEWSPLVTKDSLPSRPDWVNIYLADNKGHSFNSGREIKGITCTEKVYQFDITQEITAIDGQNYKITIFPNPTNEKSAIYLQLQTNEYVDITIYDNSGKEFRKITSGGLVSGNYSFTLNTGLMKSGIYLCNVRIGKEQKNLKFIVTK